MLSSPASDGPAPVFARPASDRPLSASLRPIGGETPAWLAAARRLERRLPAIRLAYWISTNGAAFAAMAVSGVALVKAAGWLAPGCPSLAAALLALAPAAFTGLAAAHAAGGLALRLATGLRPFRRRAFALRLGAGQAPARWPGWLRRWLFGGDWLAGPGLRGQAPYLRAFLSGAPAAEDAELSWWGTIAGHLGGRGRQGAGQGWEPGFSHHETSYAGSLPRWTLGLQDGASLAQVLARTGPATREWAAQFWRRAALLTPGLGDPETPDAEAFGFWRVALGGGRDALVVTLAPRPGAEAETARHEAGAEAA